MLNKSQLTWTDESQLMWTDWSVNWQTERLCFAANLSAPEYVLTFLPPLHWSYICQFWSFFLIFFIFKIFFYDLLDCCPKLVQAVDALPSSWHAEQKSIEVNWLICELTNWEAVFCSGSYTMFLLRVLQVDLFWGWGSLTASRSCWSTPGKRNSFLVPYCKQWYW